jgi:hemoglobin
MTEIVKQTLFDEVGGLPTLKKVHKIFYDKVYAHPWIGQFFIGHDQKAIENRQTSFMGEKMGGQIEYMGKEMELTHEAMYITGELFRLRQSLLEESLLEAGLSGELRERWLRIDGAFKKKIVKGSLDSFMNITWPYKKHIVIPKP